MMLDKGAGPPGRLGGKVQVGMIGAAGINQGQPPGFLVGPRPDGHGHGIVSAFRLGVGIVGALAQLA